MGGEENCRSIQTDLEVSVHVAGYPGPPPHFTLLLCDLHLSRPSCSHPRSRQEVICKGGSSISKRQEDLLWQVRRQRPLCLPSLEGKCGPLNPSSWLLRAAHSSTQQDDTLPSLCFPSLLPLAASGPGNQRYHFITKTVKNQEEIA